MIPKMLSFVVQVIATMLKFVIAYTLIFPSLTIVALFNEICRIFVSLSLLWTKYRLFGFGLSNMFYLAGPFHGGLNLCVLVSQDEVDIEKERSRFQRVLSQQTKTGGKTFKRLTETLSCQQGYGCWKHNGENFDIRNHVKLYDLSKPGQGRDYFTQEELLDSIFTRLWQYMDCDDSQPEWEWLIVQRVLMPEGLRTMRIFRFHHAYMDGVTTAMLLSRGLMDQPSPPFVFDLTKQLPPWQTFMLLVSKVYALLRVPYFLLETFLHSQNNRNHLQKDPFLAVNSERKITMKVSSVVPVENLRQLKNKYDKTASVTSIIASAARSALALVAKQKGVYNATMNLSVPLAVPVYPDISPRNRISFVKVHLPLDAEDEDELVQIPGARDLLSAYFLLRWMDRFPRPVFNLFHKFQGGAFISTMFNNLPFLRNLGSIDGSVIEEVMVWPHPKKPVGLLITGVRYGDSIRFYSSTDDSVFSRDDAKLLLDAFTDELGVKEWENDYTKP